MDNETKEDGSPALSSDKNSRSGGPNKEQIKERETFSIKRKAFSHGKERKEKARHLYHHLHHQNATRLV